ncbi:MAG: flavodoxin domain-containing protein, partial [Hyphomicrobiaceae bacterium]|nr:flavodoxin domain-containing protein [Hyphomicrobiaceae bacterium]
MPVLPKTAPFSPEDIAALNAIVARSNSEQRSWLAGFLAGYEAAQATSAGATVAPVAAPRVKVPVTLLYGSESGNAEGLALKAKKAAAKLGYDAKVVDMGDIEPAALAKMSNLIVYVSTWGEGDPPQRAVEFYNGLMAGGAPRLDGLRYSVLALGDTAYAEFCATGKRIDARLEALGAKRAVDRIDLDLDFAKS